MKDIEDTIVAISTAPGPGAIGIVRLSGFQALSLLQRVWSGAIPTSQFEPRKAYLGTILGDNKVPIDKVLILFMQAPSSYTGEDLIEVQAHGNPRILDSLLEVFITAGARLALPGEFTKRAFLNGRMDLLQAEAVADLIHASSTWAALHAERQLEGNLSQYIGKLRNDLKIMRAQMEAMIDFPEDGDIQELRIGYHQEVGERIGRLLQQIKKLLSTYEEGRILREGLRVAIVGKPNVGKSSLFNALLRSNRAIVHSTPGTTRDLIEEAIDLKGLLIRFIDTAGIRKGEESIESEGIRRTHERLKQADLVLAVFDSSRPFHQEDEMVLEALTGTRVFCIYNKVDLPAAFSQEDLQKRATHQTLIPLSAKEEKGLDQLKEAILTHFTHQNRHPDDLVLTNLRHKVALEKGQTILAHLQTACEEKRPLELLAEDLSLAMNSLGEITGEVSNDEILGEIFSKFCIGK